MSQPLLLSETEFKACFAEPMKNVTAQAEAKVDIWPYIDAIDLDDLGIPSIADVHYVYRDALDRFDQVLIGTGRFNSLLAIIVDRKFQQIVGHHLLDLKEAFGVRGDHLRSRDSSPRT